MFHQQGNDFALLGASQQRRAVDSQTGLPDWIILPEAGCELANLPS